MKDSIRLKKNQVKVGPKFIDNVHILVYKS